MTNGFIVEILTLLWEVRYLFRIWINSPVSRKQILLSLILSTSHNGTFIVVLFSGNFFHWSRLKSCSPDKSFSWTFNLLLTNSNRYPFVWSLISKYIKKKKKKEKKKLYAALRNHSFNSRFESNCRLCEEKSCLQ